jgi:GT2 family glycosyltransferase
MTPEIPPQSHVTALIVTFNRRALLMQALSAIAGQTRPPDRILIVDNASTDGTRDLLQSEGWLQRQDVELLALNDNTGGAGGFSVGLKQAMENGADWVWMMDDDAEPHPDALAELMRVATMPGNVYGSLATSGASTSWAMTLLETQTKTMLVSDFPACAEVLGLPFLGILVHRELVERIGLPDAGLFIAGDDVEYCARARRAGARIFVAGKSHIEHPQSQPYPTRFLFHELTCLALPPWKRYYDTRNRILIARRHFGIRLLTQTLPGLFVRWLATLRKEPRKWAQSWAFVAGLTDGLLGRKGKRHEKWGIRP